MKKNQYANFVMFMRFTALNLLLSSLVVETKNGALYGVLGPLQVFKLQIFSIPYVPGISIMMINQEYVQILLKIHMLFSYFFLFFKPTSRWAYGMVALVMLFRNTLSHLSTGVDSASIYLIPFLLLLIEPAREENVQKVSRRIICAFAMMYAFSAFNKVNSVYFSGIAFSNDILIRNIFKSFLTSRHFELICLLGIVSQVFASLVIFYRTRKLAIVSLWFFHFFVAVTIIWSVPLAFFGYSLLLLFSNDRILHSYFWVLVTLRILFSLALLLWGNFFPYSNYFDGLSIGIVILCMIFALHSFKNYSVHKENTISLSGLSIPLMYVALAFILKWPEPFGYTQYSEKKYMVTFLEFPFQNVDKNPNLKYLNGRWSFKVFKDKSKYMGVFVSSIHVNKLLVYYCNENPSFKYKKIDSKEEINIKLSKEETIKYLEKSDWIKCSRT